jgi:hypothetical protein
MENYILLKIILLEIYYHTVIEIHYFFLLIFSWIKFLSFYKWNLIKKRKRKIWIPNRVIFSLIPANK